MMACPSVIRKTYRCRLKTETPLHIGSGDVLQKDFDFYWRNGKITVIDRGKLFRRVEDFGEEGSASFARALEDKGILAWLTDNEVPLKDVELYAPLSWPQAPSQIRAQIRDGCGKPLVPGSSLKGALRTAILKRLSREDGKKVVAECVRAIRVHSSTEPTYPDRDICKPFLGEDPQTDLLRTLTVGDLAFAPDAVGLQDVVVTRLVSGRELRPRPRRGRENLPVHITVEIIRGGTTSQGRVSFDRFLVAQRDKGGEHYLGFKADLTLTWLLEALRELTREFITSELQFLYRKTGAYVDQLQQFYRDQQMRLDGLAQNEALLHLGWGIGWRGMTGELIDNCDLSAEENELRRKLKLAPEYLDCPFPKSRRLAITGNWALPMGWVHLSFSPTDDNHDDTLAPEL